MPIQSSSGNNGYQQMTFTTPMNYISISEKYKHDSNIQTAKTRNDQLTSKSKATQIKQNYSLEELPRERSLAKEMSGSKMGSPSHKY